MSTTLWLVMGVAAVLIVAGVYFVFRKRPEASAEVSVGSDETTQNPVQKAFAKINFGKVNPWAVAFGLALVAVLVLGSFMLFRNGGFNLASDQPTFQAVTLTFAPTAGKTHLRSFFGEKITEGKEAGKAAWLVDDQPGQGLTTGLQSVPTGKNWIINLEVRGGGKDGWATDDGNSMAVTVVETGRVFYLNSSYLTSFVDYLGRTARVYQIHLNPSGEVTPVGSFLASR